MGIVLAPTVSIQGASKLESMGQLLQRAQEQRNLREVQCKETSAANSNLLETFLQDVNIDRY